MDLYRYLWMSYLCTVIACQSGEETSGNENEKESSFKVRPRDRKQYRHGDIILGAAMQVSWADDNGQCVEEITGMQLVETMNMIIDKVNVDEKILPGVKLGTLMIDTCSSDSHALQRVIMDILPLALDDEKCLVNCSTGQKEPILAGIVGASLSSVSMQLATILQVFSIPQVSYWSTSTELSDKTRYRYFFRSVPPDIHQVEAMISFVKQMGWNYISVIYEDDNYGVDAYKEILRKAEKSNICIALSKALTRRDKDMDVTPIIKELLAKKNSRVVITLAMGANAEKLLVAAQAIPEARESLVWIGADGWIGYLPRDPKDDSYLESMDGTIGFLPMFSPIPNLDQYMTNLTLRENFGVNSSRNPWFADHLSKRNNCSLPGEPDKRGRKCDLDESIDPSTFRTYNVPIADAVYAFVHALDDLHKDVCSGRSGICEEIIEKAENHKLGVELFNYLKNVSFIGAGGTTFEFDENHDGPPIYEAHIFQKSKVVNNTENILDGWTKVGVYQNNDIKWDIELPKKILSAMSTCSFPCGRGEAQIRGTQKCCWFCQKCTSNEYVLNHTACQPCELGYKPNKAVNGCEPLPIRKMEYSSSHSIFAIGFGIFGLICTSYVTVIFIKYKETAIVRASGKELCFFVLFGVFVTLLNSFSVTSYPSELSCATSRVILSIGPSCMYVGLLMKTIRVVFIFQSKGILAKKTKEYLQPLQFILLTVAVAFIQIVILIIWFIIKHPKPELLVFEDFAFLSCRVLVDIEILIGLVFPFIIIIVCTILATVNRNVPTGFRETLYVGFTMYTTCIIWLAFLPIFLTNSTDVPKKLTTVSTALTLSAITILLCLFGPRSFAILFHPEWNTTESVMSRSRSYSVKKRPSSSVYPDLGTSVSVKRTEISEGKEDR